MFLFTLHIVQVSTVITKTRTKWYNILYQAKGYKTKKDQEYVIDSGVMHHVKAANNGALYKSKSEEENG